MSRAAPRIGLVVVQPTPFCNINCSYCYLPDRSNRKVMSDQTAARMAEAIFASGWIEREVTFVWHAGEPMILPIPFYRKTFSIIQDFKPQSIDITHSFQTNGTLISDEWCNFINETGIKIGVSIDGPQHIHDKCRKTRLGGGTFTKVMDGISKLKSHKIDFSIICVLTAESLSEADLMFDFFEDLGVSRISFNVEELEGANQSSSLHHHGAEARFREFMARFWARSFKSQTINVVREIEEMMACVVRPDGTAVRNTQVEPFAMLNIDCQGNFSTFSPELLGLKNDKYGDYIIGNINEMSLSDGLESDALKKMMFDIDLGVRECQKRCEYFSVCGGGSPVNKISETGTFTSSETNFCRLKTKAVCDLSLNLLQSLH